MISVQTKAYMSCNQQQNTPENRPSPPDQKKTKINLSTIYFHGLNSDVTFRLGTIYIYLPLLFLFGITSPICFTTFPQKSEKRIDHHKARDPKEMQQQFH